MSSSDQQEFLYENNIIKTTDEEEEHDEDDQEEEVVNMIGCHRRCQDNNQSSSTSTSNRQSITSSIASASSSSTASLGSSSFDTAFNSIQSINHHHHHSLQDNNVFFERSKPQEKSLKNKQHLSNNSSSSSLTEMIVDFFSNDLNQDDSTIILEKIFSSYPFLIPHEVSFKDSSKSGCSCRVCVVDFFVDFILSLDSLLSFDRLLKLTLFWINCFHADFDEYFDCTRRLLIRLKEFIIEKNNDLPEETEEESEENTLKTAFDLLSLSMSLKSRNRINLFSSPKVFSFSVKDDKTQENSSKSQEEEIQVIFDSKTTAFVSKDFLVEEKKDQQNFCTKKDFARKRILFREGDVIIKPSPNQLLFPDLNEKTSPSSSLIQVKFDPFSYQNFLRRNRIRNRLSNNFSDEQFKSSTISRTNHSKKKTSSLVSLQVFCAKNSETQYLLVEESTTTAREVVMILARDLFFQESSSLVFNSLNFRRKSSRNSTSSLVNNQSNASGMSSLDFALYELSVCSSSSTKKNSYNENAGVIVRCRRIADSSVNLWSNAVNFPFCRLILKQVSSADSEVTEEKKLRSELVESFMNEKGHPSLTNIDSIVLALELSYHAFALFSSLDSQSILKHVLESTCDPKDKSSTLDDNNDTRSSRQERLLRLWESLTEAEMFWSINEILAANSVEERIRVVKTLVKTALFCLFELKNFSSASSITCALGHSSVSRLRKSLWIPLSKNSKYKNLLKELEKLNRVLDPSKNMSFYRKMLSEALIVQDHGEDNTSLTTTAAALPTTTTMTTTATTTPTKEGHQQNRRKKNVVIPFYPIHKKDFTFIHLTSETFLPPKEKKRVNFDKICDLLSAIKEFLCLASSLENEESEEDEHEEDKTTAAEEDAFLDHLLLLNSSNDDSVSSQVFLETSLRDRRRYPWNVSSIPDKFRHPLLNNMQSADAAKKVDNFLSRERSTRSFLRQRFLKRSSILFNEDLLMQRSMDIEQSASSSNQNTMTPTMTPTAVKNQSHEQQPITEESSLEKLNSNFHGILSLNHSSSVSFGRKMSSQSTSTTGTTGSQLAFGVTSYDQLNKLLSLQKKTESSSSCKRPSVVVQKSASSVGCDLRTTNSSTNQTPSSSSSSSARSSGRSSESNTFGGKVAILAPNALYPSPSAANSVVNNHSLPLVTSGHHHHHRSLHQTSTHAHLHHNHHVHHRPSCSYSFPRENSGQVVVNSFGGKTSEQQQPRPLSLLTRESSSLGPALLYPSSVVSNVARNRPTTTTTRPPLLPPKSTITQQPIMMTLPSYDQTMITLMSSSQNNNNNNQSEPSRRSRSTSCPRITTSSSTTNQRRENLV